MKKTLIITAVLLCMAAMASAQGGPFFNLGAVYISNDMAEVNKTFQTVSRPARLWGTSHWVLVRFDYTEFTNIPANSPCTLYLTKTASAPWPTATQVWSISDVALYLVKGNWQEGSLDTDADNSNGGISWNYRAYPTTWSGTTTGNTNFTSAQIRPNTRMMFSGVDLNDPAYVALDNRLIDSMKTGRFGGFVLVPQPGAMYYLAHTGHYIQWGAVAVEKDGRTASSLAMNASPNPFTASVALSVRLRSTDKNVSLVIYGLNGQKVADLSSQLEGGKNATVAWNAAALPNSVYLAKLTAGNAQITRRITLMK